MQRKAHVSRRDFVKTAAATVAATGAFPYFARGQAADRPLKIGIVGCGGRGTGAGHDAMNADPNVKVVALADVFKDRVEGCRKSLTDKGRTEIKNENCFVGFDAYQKLLQTDVDYVILATPPYYRPEHFEACVKAGKHVFTEKPVAVDPVGIRRFMAAGKLADEKGLSVVAGTQRRHQKGYIETINRIRDGAIGDIVAGRCYWNMGQLWYRPRQNGWDDMEWMIRDWVNWTWLSARAQHRRHQLGPGPACDQGRGYGRPASPGHRRPVRHVRRRPVLSRRRKGQGRQDPRAQHVPSDQRLRERCLRARHRDQGLLQLQRLDQHHRRAGRQG
jgi:hypothetical protein